MKFGGFDWDSGNLPKCLGHGASMEEIEALFAGDFTIVRDAVVGGCLVAAPAAGYFHVFPWRGDRIRPVSVR